MPLPHHALNRLVVFFLLAFVALATVTGYWSLLRRESLTGRADNPRLVLAEQRIQRGDILDRHGRPLARTEGAPGDYVRVYPLPVAAPVVGYASITYGVAGVEEVMDAALRGEADRSAFDRWWRHTVLHEPQVGRNVRLTLDGDLQATAAAALSPHAGAIVALDPHSGALLALVSLPTFDANTLNADWETLIEAEAGPLYNRATFGLYQSGAALQPALMSAALNAGLLTSENIPPDAETLAAVVAALGPERLASTLQDFGLLTQPDIPLPAQAIDDAVVEQVLANPSQLAAGESEFAATPLQMALVAATLANDGVRPPLQLIAAVETPSGDWGPYPVPGHALAVLAPDVAAQVEHALQAAAPEENPGIVGHAATVQQTTSPQPLGWFIGYSEDHSLALAVVVEEQSAEIAARVGQAVFGAWEHTVH